MICGKGKLKWPASQPHVFLKALLLCYIIYFCPTLAAEEPSASMDRFADSDDDAGDISDADDGSPKTMRLVDLTSKVAAQYLASHCSKISSPVKFPAMHRGC